MMNALVVYYSKYGHTERYAQAIGRELDCPVRTLLQARNQDLSQITHLIYGAPIYFGKFKGANFLENHLDKNLWIFMVGLSSPNSDDYQKVFDQSVSKEVSNHAKFRPMHGGLNFPQLSWIHKFMMYGIKKQRFDKLDLLKQDETFQTFMANYYQNSDFYDASAVSAMVKDIRVRG